jgi:hypothetical protein
MQRLDGLFRILGLFCVLNEDIGGPTEQLLLPLGYWVDNICNFPIFGIESEKRKSENYGGFTHYHVFYR